MNHALIRMVLGFFVFVHAEAKPNLVFILADDLGWSDTSLYGHTEYYQTPNIERLAKRGMTFSRAYTASPLCSPTRASILTGKNPARTGFTAPHGHIGAELLKPGLRSSAPANKKAIQPNSVTRLDTSHITLAEALQEQGYVTGHFGKWHLGKEPYSPLEHGFSVDRPHWPGPGPAGSYVAPWKFPDFEPDTPDQHIEDRMAREAVDFIEKNKDQPFFLNYWMFSVHAPFDAKKQVIEKYRKTRNPEDAQRSPTYAAMIESMDDAIGTLLDALDRLELTENTLIIFFSDNGGNMYNQIDGTTPTSNRPLRGGKATMYEGGVRVPLVVSWPGRIEADSRSEVRVSSDDFFPTIADLFGIEMEPPPVFDGQSFRAALMGEPYQRPAHFTYFPHDPGVPDWLPPSIGVYKDHWKLIRIFHGGEDGQHRWKLFDLESDIGENNNLANDLPEKVQEMDRLIDGFLEETSAVVPVVNPDFDPEKYRPELEGVPKIKKPKDPLKGWKARSCTATVGRGIITVEGTGDEPFLGVGAGVAGPAIVNFFASSVEPGDGKIEWIPQDKQPESIPFQLNGKGSWQRVQVRIPAEEENLGILRIYLPATENKVKLKTISIRSESGKLRAWRF